MSIEVIVVSRKVEKLSEAAAAVYEIPLTGQNLLHKSHLEFIPFASVGAQHTYVERGVYGAITWRF